MSNLYPTHGIIAHNKYGLYYAHSNIEINTGGLNTSEPSSSGSDMEL